MDEEFPAVAYLARSTSADPMACVTSWPSSTYFAITLISYTFSSKVKGGLASLYSVMSGWDSCSSKNALDSPGYTSLQLVSFLFPPRQKEILISTSFVSITRPSNEHTSKS